MERAKQPQTLLKALLDAPNASLSELAKHCGWVNHKTGEPEKWKAQRLFRRMARAPKPLVRNHAGTWTLTVAGKTAAGLAAPIVVAPAGKLRQPADAGNSIDRRLQRLRPQLPASGTGATPAPAENVVATIRSRVEQRRTELGLNASEIARRVGRDPSTVHDLIAGRNNNPSIRLVRDIASTLGCSIGYLIGEAERPEIEAKRAVETLAKLVEQYSATKRSLQTAMETIASLNALLKMPSR
jgi:transcriptional regulator with XRE-family HTH domain